MTDQRGCSRKQIQPIWRYHDSVDLLELRKHQVTLSICYQFYFIFKSSGKQCKIFLIVKYFHNFISIRIPRFLHIENVYSISELNLVVYITCVPGFWSWQLGSQLSWISSPRPSMDLKYKTKNGKQTMNLFSLLAKPLSTIILTKQGLFYVHNYFFTLSAICFLSALPLETWLLAGHLHVSLIKSGGKLPQ